MTPPSDNVVAGAILTFATVIQGVVSVTVSRRTRKSLSDQLQNGLRGDVHRIEKKVDGVVHDVGRLQVQVARIDERTKME